MRNSWSRAFKLQNPLFVSPKMARDTMRNLRATLPPRAISSRYFVEHFFGKSWITATFTGPRRKTCKQEKPRGSQIRVQPTTKAEQSKITVKSLFMFSDRDNALANRPAASDVDFRVCTQSPLRLSDLVRHLVIVSTRPTVSSW